MHLLKEETKLMLKKKNCDLTLLLVTRSASSLLPRQRSIVEKPESICETLAMQQSFAPYARTVRISEIVSPVNTLPHLVPNLLLVRSTDHHNKLR